MRARRTTYLLCLTLLLSVAGSGCPAKPSPEHPHGHRPGGPDGPRIRVGKVLRLARAGTLKLVRQGKVRGVAARVPQRFRKGSWQRAIDSQGNQFRVSPAGLLVTDGEPRPGREPASVANVAYYYTQAYSLMAARYRRQGLVMAAEVLDQLARKEEQEDPTVGAVPKEPPGPVSLLVQSDGDDHLADGAVQ